MPLTIKDPLYQSILAEKSRRWDDMVLCADQLAGKGELNLQERGIFAEAYRQYINKYRTAWRLLGQIDQRKKGLYHAEKEIERYRDTMSAKVIEQAQRGQDILSKLALDPNQPDQVCWVAKQKADLLRYMAEVDRSKVREAEEAYVQAVAAADRLAHGDTLRLMTLLNQAVFVCDIEKDNGKAIELLTTALDEAPEATHKDEETLIRGLMVQNLKNWQSSSVL